MDEERLHKGLFTGVCDIDGNKIHEGNYLIYKFDTKIQLFNHGKEVHSPGYKLSVVKFIPENAAFMRVIIKQKNCGAMPKKPDTLFFAHKFWKIISKEEAEKYKDSDNV